MTKKRLFVAINLPEEVKKKIHETFIKLVPERGYKPVKQENLHLTLAFLGYLDESQEKQVKEKLASVKQEKFSLRLQDLGHFHYRVIWLGATEGSKQAQELFEKVKQALSLEEERFSSHITLVRIRHPNKKEARQLMEKLSQKKFDETIEVSSFELMESVLSREGPTYSMLRKYPLEK